MTELIPKGDGSAQRRIYHRLGTRLRLDEGHRYAVGRRRNGWTAVFPMQRDRVFRGRMR